jgi:hypothetical protein
VPEPAAHPNAVDTGWREFPAVRVTDERTIVTSMLDWYREGVLLKVAGLAPHLAATTSLRSGTTIGGLVKHLASDEDSWFTDRFAGRDLPEPWASAPFDEDPDWEFHSAAADPLDDLVALYTAACDRSRAAIADAPDLDQMAAKDGGKPFNLRFVLFHMTEETARHLGHLDILREHLDGNTGE